MAGSAWYQKEHLLVWTQDTLVCNRVCSLTSSCGFLSLLVIRQKQNGNIFAESL